VVIQCVEVRKILLWVTDIQKRTGRYYMLLNERTLSLKEKLIQKLIELDLIGIIINVLFAVNL